MKKRIGSKLYDTEKSEAVFVSPLGTLYRKRTRAREWFLCDEKYIFTPLTNEDAERLIGELPDNVPESATIMVRVDRETHNIIAEEAKRRGVSMTEALRSIVTELRKI